MSKRNPIFYLALTGWHYAGKYRPLMVLYVALFACAQAISLAEPYVIGRLLNSVQQNVGKGANFQHLVNDIYLYLGLFFAIQFFFWAFHGPGRLVERFVQFHIKANYKTALFKMVTELPLQWHREHHSGDSIDKINRASNSLAAYFEMTFEVSYMLFRLIGTQIILFCFMPIAGWVAMVTSAVSFTIVYLFDRVLSDQYFELNKMDNRVASAVHDYVTNIVSVITLRLEHPVLQEVRRRLFVSLKLYKDNNVINEVKWFLTTMLIGTMIVAVLLWYTHNTLAAGQVILSGTFFTLFEYLRRIGDSFYNFAYIYGSVVRQAADVQSADPLIEAHELLQTETEKWSTPSNWQELQVNNLHFTYEDEKQKTHHLEDVSVKLKRGLSIALVGESGSGKSTFLSLLRGVQFAGDVSVVCDGVVLPGKLAHLSHCTTLMPQDPEIFADTIGFNITFGFEGTEESVMDAVKLARFDSVLERLPHGLETGIAEKGVNLSGGEKQRLALARGVYFAKSSDIVLLDEPTSSVDTYNERKIYEKILERFADKCVVSSVHKLHLLEMFDMIYVFDDGRIVESGSFNELLSTSGVLSEMWRNYQISDSIIVADTIVEINA